MTKNDVLDRSMQAAKNLMTIELKDREHILTEKIHALRNDGVLRSLNIQCQEILNSEKSEIISNSPWLQKLVEATQDAIYQIDADCRLDIPDQEDALSSGSIALTDDSGIITASNVLNDVRVIVKENDQLDVTYSINRLLMPWAENTDFKITNYTFQPSEAAILLKREKHRDEINLLEKARSALSDKTRNMKDLLLRVETDLLLKQIKSDAIGESSIDTIKELMGKYLGNTALPEGMSLIE